MQLVQLKKISVGCMWNNGSHVIRNHPMGAVCAVCPSSPVNYDSNLPLIPYNNNYKYT